ncbi:hypothetical protein K488DRAFT_83655 [Vararia minispora EC-137]|uniref:Uncharacterized protein n=1 Tax=Vararia minispora EC-137 TaxID=1314806 RepID=A0ACB8QTD5_9AGAM|nr:hypothetical protein K488DRAFT_83655 [Vararia minispora EC-137]
MASAAEVHFVRFAVQWSSIALLYYDYALTFPSEVKYIWDAGRFSKLSTLLYVLCRYALLANVLYLLAISGNLGNKCVIAQFCDIWYKIIGASSVLGRMAVIFTILMRTYVVWAKNTFVLVGFGMMGIAILVCDVIHVPGLRCEGSSSIPIGQSNTLLTVLACIFEASATLLSFVRSVQALRFVGGIPEITKHTLLYLMAEQGIIYFALVSLFTVSSTVLNFVSPSSIPGFNV